MIFNLFRRKTKNDAIVKQQYEIITQAARNPVFYRDMNVPDKVMGRFEMVSVHLMLYFRKTDNKAENVSQLAQSLVDAFFEDVDHSIRELGIGDAGVPKRMKKFASMFYGRLKSYGDALDASDLNALEDALKRNIFAQKIKDLEKSESAKENVSQTLDKMPELKSLAQYIMHADNVLSDVNDDTLAKGLLTFPQPEAKSLSDIVAG